MYCDSLCDILTSSKKQDSLPDRLEKSTFSCLPGRESFCLFVCRRKKQPSVSCRAGFGGGRFCRFSLAVDDHEDREDVHDADGNIQRHLLPEDNHQNEETQAKHTYELMVLQVAGAFLFCVNVRKK